MKTISTKTAKKIHMITPTEIILIIIALAILMIWGPSKIPQLARAIGKAIFEFKKAKEGLEKEVKEVTKPVKEALEPAKELVNTAREAKKIIEEVKR